MTEQYYHNIFNCYHRICGTEDEDEKESVLENNVTKALVNVLELSDPQSSVRKEFVDLLGKRVGTHLSPSISHYVLQRTKPAHYDTVVAPSRTKFMLGIVPKGREDRWEEGIQRDRGTRPDAWLIGKNWTVLVESKLRRGLENAQVNGHKRLLRCNRNPVEVNWKDIHSLMRNLTEGEKCTPKDKFLLTQFCDFLELNGLAGFTGLTRQDLDFIGMDQEEKRENYHLREALIGKLWALAEELWESDSIRRMYPWYGDPSTCLLHKPKQYASFFFVDQGIPKKELRALEQLSNAATYRTRERGLLEEIKARRAYVEVHVDREFIEVYVGVDKDPLRKLADFGDSKWNGLWDIAKAIPVTFSVQLLNDDSRSLLGRRKSEITKSEITEDEAWVHKIRKSVQGAALSASENVFAITRRWDRREVLQLKGCLVGEISAAMRELYPVVKFINDEADGVR